MTQTNVIFDRKNVLVIGGAGFIGSHICDELVKHAKVICIDNYVSGSVDNITHLLQNPNFIFLRLDINEPLDLSRYPELELFEVQFQGIQEIYYCACPTIQKGFEDYAPATVRTNSLGVLHALDLARLHHAKFLFTSTRSVYGDPLDGQKEFREDYWGFVNNLSERACYNEGKRFAETTVMTYQRTYDIDTKIARLFNTYGPRMRANSGRQIPDFILAAHEGRDLMILGDGSTMDTYCYIEDMIQGLVALMASNIHEPVNFGNTVQYSIIDIANRIIELLHMKSNIVFTEGLAGLVQSAPPDVNRARRQLGWFPVTELDEGLQKTVDDMLGARVLRYQPLGKEI